MTMLTHAPHKTWNRHDNKIHTHTLAHGTNTKQHNKTKSKQFLAEPITMHSIISASVWLIIKYVCIKLNIKYDILSLIVFAIRRMIGDGMVFMSADGVTCGVLVHTPRNCAQSNARPHSSARATEHSSTQPDESK